MNRTKHIANGAASLSDHASFGIRNVRHSISYGDNRSWIVRLIEWFTTID